MTDLFFLFALFNFLIIYGSMFYIMDLRITIKRVIASMLINTFVAVLAVSYPHSLWIPMIFSIVASGVLFFVMTRKQLAFFHLLFIYLCCVLAEYIALIVVDIFHLSITVHSSIILLQIAVIMIGYKKILARYDDKVRLPGSSQLVLLLVAVSTGLVFYVLIFLPGGKGEIPISTGNLVILLFYFMTMLVLIRILLQTMMKEQDVQEKFIEQQQFTQYMQSLEQVNRNMQAFRHDHTNILLSMRGYMENGDMTGLKTYFDEEVTKVEHHTLYQNQLFSQLDRLQLIEIKGLISTKLLRADELSIPVSVEVPELIEDCSVSRLHLSRVIGNLLDNAIEASVVVDNPQINLAFLAMKGELVIVIENRISDSELPVQPLFGERYSTKGENRGRGLPAVRGILSGYPNITWNTRIDHQWFIHEIMIKEEFD